MRWVTVLAAIFLASAAGAAAAHAQGCDENDPNGPTRGAQVTLTASDSVDDSRRELRTFVVTGSLGRVEAAIVAATPPGVVRGFAAAPHLSRLSPDYGEQLKGIAVVATLSGGNRSARIVVRLRQVCAQSFRDSFLSD
jgi:PhoPQ-activated pathogenicity-related protein